MGAARPPQDEAFETAAAPPPQDEVLCVLRGAPQDEAFETGAIARRRRA